MSTLTPTKTANEWSGVDYSTTKGIVRTTREDGPDGPFTLYRFTTNHVLMWQVRMDATAPASLWHLTVEAALETIR